MLFQNKKKESPVGMWMDSQPSANQQPLLSPASPGRTDYQRVRVKMTTLRKLQVDLKSRIAFIGTNKDTNSFRRENADLSEEVGALLNTCKNEIERFQLEEYKRIQSGKSNKPPTRRELSEKEVRKIVTKLRLELEEITRSVHKILDDMTSKNKRHIENVRQTMIGSRKMSKMTGNNHTSSQDSSHGYGRADSNRTEDSEVALFHQHDSHPQQSQQQPSPQFLEIDIQSQIINNRQQDLDRIQKVMNDVKDIAVSINQEAVSQEEKIDQIANKTEKAKENVSEGNKELDKASVLQKSGTCRLLIIVGAIVLVVVIVIIVLVVLKQI